MLVVVLSGAGSSIPKISSSLFILLVLKLFSFKVPRRASQVAGAKNEKANWYVTSLFGDQGRIRTCDLLLLYFALLSIFNLFIVLHYRRYTTWSFARLSGLSALTRIIAYEYSDPQQNPGERFNLCGILAFTPESFRVLLFPPV